MEFPLLTSDEGPSLETSIFLLSFQVVRESLPFAYKLQQVCCRLVALQLSSRYLDAGATSQVDFQNFIKN